jgi:hypothetical protein
VFSRQKQTRVLYRGVMMQDLSFPLEKPIEHLTDAYEKHLDYGMLATSLARYAADVLRKTSGAIREDLCIAFENLASAFELADAASLSLEMELERLQDLVSTTADTMSELQRCGVEDVELPEVLLKGLRDYRDLLKDCMQGH